LSSEDARRVDRECIVLTGTKREERLVGSFSRVCCALALLFRRHTIYLASEHPIVRHMV